MSLASRNGGWPKVPGGRGPPKNSSCKDGPRGAGRAGGTLAPIALLGVDFAHIRDAQRVVVVVLVRNCGVVVVVWVVALWRVRTLALRERSVVSLTFQNCPRMALDICRSNFGQLVASMKAGPP